MIPDGHEYEARRVNTYYRNGRIVMEFRVLIPDDRTISGYYRYEHVNVTMPTEYVEG